MEKHSSEQIYPVYTYLTSLLLPSGSYEDLWEKITLHVI